MNILTDTLPNVVNIAGTNYPINTDFRAGVEFEIMIQEGSTDLVKVLALFFDKNIPSEDIEDIFAAIELYYCCGALPEKKKQTASERKQSYSFSVDSNAIFADFWNYYNIDLSQEGLHWWTFRSLLEGLPEGSEFKQRIYYRTCDLKGMSKKEKDRIMNIRSKLEIKKRVGEEITLETRNQKMLAYMARRRKETGGGKNG